LSQNEAGKRDAAQNFAPFMIFVDYTTQLGYIPGQNHIAAKNEKHWEKCIFF